MMDSLKPKPALQILFMSEESRLGREQIRTAYALQQLIDSGVRIFFYLENRERTLEDATEKFMLSAASFASELEREKAQQRTYDAMLRKAKAGHVTGGKVFGYDNREILSSEGHRLHVLRVVNPREAELVRQIFDMYVGGLGFTRIAKRLNAEGVLAARQSPRGWAPTAVREILYRPLYKGEKGHKETSPARQERLDSVGHPRPSDHYAGSLGFRTSSLGKDEGGRASQRSETRTRSIC